MVYRYSWIAGIVALGFAFSQMSGLLRPTTDGVPWQFVVVVGAVLGVIITSVALMYRLPGWAVVLLNALGLVISVTRIASPDTSRALLPTPETFSILEAQLRQAADVIRSGIEPVVPLTGIVIVVMTVFWVAGIAMAWGLLRNHPYVALVPPLVLTLQFATMNRGPSPLGEITLFVALVAVTILAIATDERAQTVGRMAPRGTWPSSRTAPTAASVGLLGITVVAALVAVQGFRGYAPPDGWLDWRDEQGLGNGFYGSFSYNPFVSIPQRLVSRSNTPVFQAQITGDVPADQVYFQFVTMDAYNGQQFFAEDTPVEVLDEFPYEDPDAAFFGPTVEVVADIQIERLRQQWLPSTYSVVSVGASENLRPNLRIRSEDSAVVYPGGLTFEGMVYRIRSSVPRPDLNVLATNEDGVLSVSFATAADGGVDAGLLPTPTPPGEIRDLPPSAERTLRLPDDNEFTRITDIRALARSQTRGLETDFERALALEAWFHSEEFQYRLLDESEVGHGANSVAAWLLDIDSPNYPAGYCENFATAMAVMARTLQIPSRVVLGFTPGQPVDGDPNRVVVLDRNAHAWVELWLPTQGWVRFDPTPRGQADTPQTFEIAADELEFDLASFLDFPVSDIDFSTGSSGFDVPIPDFGPEGLADFGEIPDLASGGPGPGILERIRTIVVWLLGLGLLFGGIPALKWWQRRTRMARLRSGDISAAWEDIVARLDDLREPVSASSTPVEVAESIDPAMAPLAAVYGRAIYGPQGIIGEGDVATAVDSLDATRARLSERHSRSRRVAAWFRVTSLIPRRMRRRLRKRRSRSA